MKTLKEITPTIIKYYLKNIYLNIIYISDYIIFKKKSDTIKRFTVLWKDHKPKIYDNLKTTPFDGHYIYHPAWAARIILKEKPEKHYDIGSILSFSTMLSAFLPVEFYDYRPVEIKLSNLKTKHADLLSLPFKDNSIKSISCLHTLEHVGLGRYGDPLDPDGDLKAIKELIRVLALGGTLLIAIPIGRPKIEFNAHRIYSYDQIFKYFNSLVLKEFSLIPDNAIETGIISPATKKDSDEQNYGCGCFWFKKNE